MGWKYFFFGQEALGWNEVAKFYLQKYFENKEKTITKMLPTKQKKILD